MEQARIPHSGTSDNASLALLQSYCHGENCAIETYQQAIDATQEYWIVVRLRRNLISHERRAQLLRRRIADLDGEPPESSGPWGTFVTAPEGAAATFGSESALSLLEQGEEHGLSDYGSNLTRLDPDSRRLVQDQILPEQARTRRSLWSIKQQLT